MIADFLVNSYDGKKLSDAAVEILKKNGKIFVLMKADENVVEIISYGFKEEYAEEIGLTADKITDALDKMQEF